MLIDRIEAIEDTATFKVFLIRIWFKNFDEYMKLFGNNIFKRKIATDWCLENYPTLTYKLSKNENFKNRKNR